MPVRFGSSVAIVLNHSSSRSTKSLGPNSCSPTSLGCGTKDRVDAQLDAQRFAVVDCVLVADLLS